jgi:hypothetical protein
MAPQATFRSSRRRQSTRCCTNRILCYFTTEAQRHRKAPPCPLFLLPYFLPLKYNQAYLIARGRMGNGNQNNLGSQTFNYMHAMQTCDSPRKLMNNGMCPSLISLRPFHIPFSPVRRHGMVRNGVTILLSEISDLKGLFHCPLPLTCDIDCDINITDPPLRSKN